MSYCNLPFNKIRIKSNGDVSFCCIQDAILGNLLKSSLEDIWMGQISEEVRSAVNSGNMHYSCASKFCPHEFSKRKPETSSPMNLPMFIDLDLPNTHCNIGGKNPNKKNPACIMCPRSSIKFKPEEDRVNDICLKIKKYIINLRKIHIQGIAEPFWKNRIFEVMDLLELQKHPKVIVSTFTNATLFKESQQDKFLSIPSSFIYFSLDAATSETYKKIRILDVFELVIKNIKRYNIKKSSNQKSVLACNVNLHNLSETTEIVKIGKQLNFNWVEFNSTDPCDDSMKDFCCNRNNNYLFKEKQKEIESISHKIGIKVSFIKPIFKNFGIKLC